MLKSNSDDENERESVSSDGTVESILINEDEAEKLEKEQKQEKVRKIFMALKNEICYIPDEILYDEVRRLATEHYQATKKHMYFRDDIPLSEKVNYWRNHKLRQLDIEDQINYVGNLLDQLVYYKLLVIISNIEKSYFQKLVSQRAESASVSQVLLDGVWYVGAGIASSLSATIWGAPGVEKKAPQVLSDLCKACENTEAILRCLGSYFMQEGLTSYQSFFERHFMRELQKHKDLLGKIACILDCELSESLDTGLMEKFKALVLKEVQAFDYNEDIIPVEKSCTF